MTVETHFSIETTEWQEIPLFNTEQLSIYLPRFQDSYSCSGNVNENQCFDSPIHTRLESIYEVLSETTFVDFDGNPHTLNQFVAKTETLNYENSYGQDQGDLRTKNHNHLIYTPDRVRIVVTAVDDFAIEELCDDVSGSCTLVEIPTGQSRTIWSKGYKFPLEQHIRAEEGGEWIVNRTRFDRQTGLLEGKQTPNEVANGNAWRWSQVHYDDLKLVAKETTNELGHVTRITDYDYGLGIALQSEGPGYKCSDYASNNRTGECVEDERTYALRKTAVDAHGRTVEEWISYDHEYNAVPYVLRKVKEHDYDDWAYILSGAPVSIKEYNWLRNNEWTETMTHIDTFGRILLKETVNPESGNGRQEFIYDHCGNIVEMSRNDPSANEGSSASVNYRYSYDVFGRKIRSREPDPVTGVAGNTGIDTAYTPDGKLIIQEITNDGGPASTKIQWFDRFGNLIRVAEHKNDTDGYAVTADYSYSTDNNLIRTVDGDGITTEVDFDWLGRRIEIRRADKTWKYGYDLNGNIIHITHPVRPGKSDALYTEVMEYDVLNRLTRTTPALKSLSPQQKQDWLIGPTDYMYDQDSNALGSLNVIDGPVFKNRYYPGHKGAYNVKDSTT